MKDDDLVGLRLLSERVWPHDWKAVFVTSTPCSVYVKGGAEAAVQTGTEPCGSWYQQSNGGERVWFSTSGEFETTH